LFRLAAEPTVVLPGVPERVVAALLDFLYTGEMRVEREDTADLQNLIDTLQIDPQLISVEEEELAEDGTDNESAKDKEATAKSEDNEREEEDSKSTAEEDRSDIRAEDNRSSAAADSSDSSGVDSGSASEISATTDSRKRKLSGGEADADDADDADDAGKRSR
jgi:hypothetical protein